MEPLADASHLYEVDFRARHLERPGFRIAEIRLTSTQQVPWHTHTRIKDTFYVLEGRLRIHLQDPKESVDLAPSETFAVAAGRPHLVVNPDEAPVTFLILQGVGEYDYVPLV